MKLRKKTNWQLCLEPLEARRLLSVYADFDGDGFADLAIGVPGEDNGEGMVQVLYGTASGLLATGSQVLTQTSLGSVDSSEAGDTFGASLAGGDFNNDGFTDLAVGVPGEDIGAAVDAGAVHFIFGSATGLTGSGDYILHQNTNLVSGICETGDLFGRSLAAGDFNNDGFVDLAVGVPGQDLPGKVNAGGVHIFYGRSFGIGPAGNQTFDLDSPNMLGDAAAGDSFGHAVAAGDFNGDGRDDLAIGVPLFDWFSSIDAGAVAVMFGGASGLGATGNQLHGTTVSSGANFGSSLAVGDFNGDGRDDLAAGAPFHNDGATTEVGYFAIHHGTPTGLLPNIAAAESDLSISSALSEANDHFGAALTSADFDGNGFDDLAIGVPGEDIASAGDAGQMYAIFGSASGLTISGTRITQETMATGDASENDDLLGAVLSSADFNANGKADLVISAPFEDIGVTVIDTGRVFTLNGGTTFTGAKSWGQDTPGIFDVSENGDHFGGGLDAGAGRDDSGPRDPSCLITADFDYDAPSNKLNKRRNPSGRR